MDIIHRHRKQCGNGQRERGVGQVEVGKAGAGMERDSTWGKGHTMQRADDVLLSCTLETCMVLQTNVTPINSIKNKIENEMK